jgi:hypothetical protein
MDLDGQIEMLFLSLRGYTVVDVTEPRSQVIQAREADLTRTLAELTREAPVPWRAPVAQMIPKNYRGGA